MMEAAASASRVGSAPGKLGEAMQKRFVTAGSGLGLPTGFKTSVIVFLGLIPAAASAQLGSAGSPAGIQDNSRTIHSQAPGADGAAIRDDSRGKPPIKPPGDDAAIQDNSRAVGATGAQDHPAKHRPSWRHSSVGGAPSTQAGSQK